MSFQWAYNLDGDSDFSAFDYPVDAGYASPTPGDVVKLTATGTITKAAVADANVLGVLNSTNFLGLVPNTVVAGIFNPGSVGKVSSDIDYVYRVPVKSGAPTPVVGTAYAMAIVSGDNQLDTANTAGSATIYKCVAYNAATGFAYVVITGRQLA